MSRIAKEYTEHQRRRWMRHDAWKFVPPDKLFEHKYRPDQARVPAGSPEGGQWTAEGGQSGTGILLAGSVSSDVAAECEFMHRQDLFICRAIQSNACYGQANLRYSNCMNGRPIPPLNF